MQYKYTFFRKVVFKQIVFTHSYLMVCVQTEKDADGNPKIRNTLMSQKWPMQAEVLLSF